jgi:methionyl-tRNA synthetase
MSEQKTNSKPFYITTAINYTNGDPHVGHVYEAVFTDTIARYHRFFGEDVFFLTGTDEHGQKIATKAETLGITPRELCDKYSNAFKTLNTKLQISNNHFIRTTTEEHHKNAQQLWNLCKSNGDIYLSDYTGWYNIKEETFVSDKDAKDHDYKDPDTKIAYTKISEPSYFFRLSNYKDRIIDHIKSNPTFIQPDSYKNSVLKRLENPENELRDLSISRTSFEWGVPVPDDSEHVMYVWFDALSNYLTALGGLEDDNPYDRHKYWENTTHVIGKDIIWFHAVIWPAMLMSAELKLPKTVYNHGFINDEDGRKMSKTLGNVVDPYDCLKMIDDNSDLLRYYLIREPLAGHDLSFSYTSLKNLANSELADAFGNLFNRGISMCIKYCEGKIPSQNPDVVFNIEKLLISTVDHINNFELKEAVHEVSECVTMINKYVSDSEPWKLKDDPERRATIVRTILETCYIFGHLFAPLTPTACDSLFEQINHPQKLLTELNSDSTNLEVGKKVTKTTVLFKKIT